MTAAAYVRRPGGTPVRLGQGLGSGGEADVFAVVDDDTAAAKIYTKDDPERQSKVELMIDHPPMVRAKAHNPFAWPTATIFDAQSQFAGFVMPRLRPGVHPLFTIYNSRLRSTAVPGFTYRYLVRTARNLAEAVGCLHASGHVVGDLNESNVMVDPTGLVTLVDCDSMQIQGPDRVFMCRVVKTEYRAPELIAADLNTTTRTTASDVFALGVLVCQLLLGGHHPYNGVSHSVTVDADVSERIRLGQSPLNARSQVKQPPGAPALSTLPQALRDALTACIGPEPRQRPTAGQVAAVLSAAERTIRDCDVRQDHQFFETAGHCPWCQQVSAGMSDPFAKGSTTPKPPSPSRSPAQRTRTPTAGGARRSPTARTPTASGGLPRNAWQCAHSDSAGPCRNHRLIGSVNCWDHGSQADRSAAEQVARQGPVTFCVAVTKKGYPCLHQPSPKLGLPACHIHCTQGMFSAATRRRSGRAKAIPASTRTKPTATAPAAGSGSGLAGCFGGLLVMLLFSGCVYVVVTTFAQEGTSGWWVVPLAAFVFLYGLIKISELGD